MICAVLSSMILLHLCCKQFYLSSLTLAKLRHSFEILHWVAIARPSGMLCFLSFFLKSSIVISQDAYSTLLDFVFISYYTGRHEAHRNQVLQYLSNLYTEQESFKQFAEQDANQYECAVPSKIIFIIGESSINSFLGAVCSCMFFYTKLKHS